MKLFTRIADLWRSLLRKRRLTMLNVSDGSEEWHMLLSPAGMLAASVSFLIVLFILILSLVAYSPVLEMLPGFRSEADRSRESLMQNIIRLDSMERVMAQMMTYNENIAMIMEGKTPV
ncbi:MAG: M23 family peptidase, partial [Alistipes sp.]|nr:M23 family peptidase [Alistipes sp.]